MKKQIPRRVTHEEQLSRSKPSRRFDYSYDYKSLDLRQAPELYRVGVGEQGVLLVQPYKSEILPHWRFRTPAQAEVSAKKITKLFHTYQSAGDFVGMDMGRKFLQMGFTRSRRYANHKSGRKYDSEQKVLPYAADPEKAQSAEIFKTAWEQAEADPIYSMMKVLWRLEFG